MGAELTAPYFFVVNPRAGSGIRVFNAVADRMRKLGVPFHAAATTGPGDAPVLAQLARQKDFSALVAVGGDGTLNELVNGLLTPDGGVDDHLPVALIPRGTAQDFARGLELPLTPAAAVEHLVNGTERRIDVGRIRFPDGSVRLFVNVLGVGLDAEVAGRAKDVRPAVASFPAHMIGLAGALADYRNRDLSLTLDGEAYRSKCSMVVIANGPYYANNMRLAPDAQLDDGELDVVIVGDLGPLDLLLNLPRAFSGTALEHDEVTLRRARHITLAGDGETLMQADGELVGRLPAEVDILPGALRMIA